MRERKKRMGVQPKSFCDFYCTPECDYMNTLPMLLLDYKDHFGTVSGIGHAAASRCDQLIYCFLVSSIKTKI